MKIYFERTNGNNLVIATQGHSAKIYDAAPSGIYAGVDLYAEDAADQLREKFLELDEAGELNGFNEMGGEEVEIGAVLLGELVDAELVFSDGEGIEVWSVEVAPDFNDDFFPERKRNAGNIATFATIKSAKIADLPGSAWTMISVLIWYWKTSMNKK